MSIVFLRASLEYLQSASAPVTAMPISMGAWFNSTNIADDQAIMALNDESSSGNSFRLHAAGNALDKITAFIHGSGIQTDISTSTAYSANTWHHALAVFASLSDIRVYIDGGSKGTTTANFTPSGIDITTIGRNEALGNYMDGQIAEAAMWNVALTDAEAAVLGKGFSPLLVRPANLVLYMPLIRDIAAGAWREFITNQSFTEGATPTVGDHVTPIFNPAPSIIELNPAAAVVTLNIPVAMQAYRQHHQLVI